MKTGIQCTPAELEQVINTYGKMVYRLAYSHTRSEANADDIYQDVFLSYFQKRPEFESEEHRRAWLLRVTVNRAKTLLNSAWFRHTAPLEECVAVFDPQERKLDDALRQLNSMDRTVLHLFYYEEMSVREIAVLLKRKESTVRTRLTRARRKLAEIVKGEQYAENGI